MAKTPKRLPSPSSKQPQRRETDGFMTLRFDIIDKNGEFAFDLRRDDFDARYVFEKLIAFSLMKRPEIIRQTHDNMKSKHHYLNYDGISPEGRQRIKKMNLTEEIDSIFSLALDNKTRVIGIYENSDFHIIWFDPRHEFYPSAR